MIASYVNFELYYTVHATSSDRTIMDKLTEMMTIVILRFSFYLVDLYFTLNNNCKLSVYEFIKNG